MKKTIGKLTKTRQILQFNTVTKVKQGKKGKGTYNRKKVKKHELY